MQETKVFIGGWVGVYAAFIGLERNFKVLVVE